MKPLRIRVSFPGNLRVAAQFGSHRVETDQGLEAGGENAAPTPFELFLVSLATCAGYFALEFCRSRELSTEGLELALETNLDAAGRRVERVRIVLALPADFPEKYRAALARSVDLCTVKRHLLDPPAVDLQFVPRSS
ncbi:MAG: OsmC family protein [Acidobacteriota bacterium]